MAGMVYGKNGLNLTKSFEKCPTKNGVVTAYWDTAGNVWTIGWGHTMGAHQGQTESQATADKVLNQDMLSFGNTVNRTIKRTMTQNQFDALTDFCFNIGQTGFPSSTCAKDFNAGNISKIPADMLMWNEAGGKYSQGVVNRRNAEIKLFKKADSVAKKTATPSKTNNNTNAVNDAKKASDQKAANAKIKAKQASDQALKEKALKASEALKKAKLTKNPALIKKAQDDTKTKEVKKVIKPIPKITVVKSSMSLIGLIAMIVVLKNGYDL